MFLYSFVSIDIFEQLRKIGNKFRNTSSLQLELEQACRDTDLEPKEMIRPVDTRWNTYADVIPRALDLRPALDRLMSQSKHNKGKGSLGKLKLSSVEWSLLQKLMPMLQVCSLFLRLYT